MPLPERRDGETQDEFIARCMSDAQAIAEFPDQDDRLGFCFTQFRAAASVENPTCLRLVSGEQVKLAKASEHEDDDSPNRDFKMVAYTGQMVEIGMFGEPMVFDLAGMEIPADENVPVFRDHDIDRPAGATNKIPKSTKTLNALGQITTAITAGHEIKALNDVGFPWQASIGIEVFQFENIPIGDSVLVNGRRIQGPVSVARKSKLEEISFVPFGADSDTMAVVLKACDGKWVNATKSVRAAKTQDKPDPEESEMPELKEVTAERDKALAKITKLEAEKAKFEEARLETEKIECAAFVTSLRKVVADKGDVTDPAILGAIDHAEKIWAGDKDTAKVIGELVEKTCETVESKKIFESPEEQKKIEALKSSIAEQKKMLESERYKVVLNAEGTKIVEVTTPKGETTKF